VLSRAWIWVVVVVLAASGCSGIRTTSTTAQEAATESAAATLTVGHDAWVSVSVATLWRTPDSPRRVDAPALAQPARVQQWLGDMTLDQRRALSGRADTQALLGDRVVVLALPSGRPRWARVAVPSQPSPLDARGYPGWVPRRQLSASAPTASAQRATVLKRTAWLFTDRAHPARLFRVSMGTSLPVVGGTSTYVRVATPGGPVRRLPRSAVVVHDAGTPALAPSRTSLVTTAKTFLGLPYLWAGASGFGLDCSGLTWLVHRVHGIRIPRDAAPQSRHGTAVSRLRRGDLMFYAANGVVHHVSMYVGRGRMIHSPSTGKSVEIVRTSVLASQYVGARRYLP
jgi:cell wall-associated NlpC family hydrolase